MFEIGFSELLIIGVVALVVLGPERLPRAARMLGLTVRRARAHWHSVKAELDRELADEELRRSLHEARDAGDALRRGLDEAAGEARRGLAPGDDRVSPPAGPGTADGDATPDARPGPADRRDDG